MALNKGDFVELDYTGRTDDEAVFDTTVESVAKEAQIQTRANFGPVVVVLGENHLLPGIDDELEGKEAGKEYSFNVPSAKAFGPRKSDLLQLIPTKKFNQSKINPFPGLQVEVDGMKGLVRSSAGGRTIVDFNHPLAGKDLSYTVNVHKVVTDAATQVQAIMALTLMQPKEEIKVAVVEKKAVISLKFDFPDQMKEPMQKEVTRLVKTIESVEFKKA